MDQDIGSHSSLLLLVLIVEPFRLFSHPLHFPSVALSANLRASYFGMRNSARPVRLMVYAVSIVWEAMSAAEDVCFRDAHS